MLDRVGGGFKDYAPFMLRVGLAVIFISAGAHALVNLNRHASTASIVVAAVQILGGLFCLIGFLTRWAAFGLAAVMVYLILDRPGVVYAVTRWDHQLYFALLVMSAALFGLGGGKWSVDEKAKRKE